MYTLTGFAHITPYVYTVWNILNKFISSIFVLFTLSIFPFRFSKRHQKLILFLCAILSGSMIQVVDNLTVWISANFPVNFTYNYLHISLISIAVISLFAFTLYTGNRFQVFLTVLLLYNFFSASRFLFQGILYMYAPPSEDLLWLFSEIPTCLFCALVSFCILHFQKTANSALSNAESIIWCLVSCAETKFMCDIPGFFNSDWEGTIAVAINILMISITIYVLLFKYSHTKYVSEEQQKLLRNLDDSRVYLSQMQETTAQFAQIRHEIKNHVFYLEELIERKDYQTMQLYVQNLKEYDLTGTSVAASGHYIIDTILNQKNAYAVSMGIHTEIQVTLPDKVFIDDLAVCSILGNLINNAIEACLKIADPYLSIDIHPYKTYLTISVKNSIDYDVLEKNPHLLTTKKDADQHGIGLKVVRHLTDQYNGILQFSMEENHLFKTSVMLLNEPAGSDKKHSLT